MIALPEHAEKIHRPRMSGEDNCKKRNNNIYFIEQGKHEIDAMGNKIKENMSLVIVNSLKDKNH